MHFIIEKYKGFEIYWDWADRCYYITSSQLEKQIQFESLKDPKNFIDKWIQEKEFNEKFLEEFEDDTNKRTTS